MSISKGCAAVSAYLLVSTLAGRALADAPPASAAPAAAATHKTGLEQKFSVMAGLSQWLLLRGGNLALEFKTGHFVFEASHGQGLDLNQFGGIALNADERHNKTRVRVPWTTGFGVGYRIIENLHLLVEFKAHHYQVRAEEGATEVSYTTFSIGPGVFYSIYLTKGLFLQPNLRFWPNVASTLENNRTLLSRCDGTSYEHEAHDFSFFGNINLGYSF